MLNYVREFQSLANIVNMRDIHQTIDMGWFIDIIQEEAMRCGENVESIDDDTATEIPIALSWSKQNLVWKLLLNRRWTANDSAFRLPTLAARQCGASAQAN